MSETVLAPITPPNVTRLISLYAADVYRSNRQDEYPLSPHFFTKWVNQTLGIYLMHDHVARAFHNHPHLVSKKVEKVVLYALTQEADPLSIIADPENVALVRSILTPDTVRPWHYSQFTKAKDGTDEVSVYLLRLLVLDIISQMDDSEENISAQFIEKTLKKMGLNIASQRIKTALHMIGQNITVTQLKRGFASTITGEQLEAIKLMFEGENVDTVRLEHVKGCFTPLEDDTDDD